MRAPSSTTIVPDEPTAKAIHSLRADSRLGLGCTTVPAPGVPATTSSSTPSREAWAITARTPDHAAILAAASFDAIPPLPADRAAGTGHGLELVVDLHDLLDQRRRRVEPGVGREQAGGVGEQHEQLGRHEVGDQGGEAVVVAEADLVVGHRVVLVDDRHHPELEEPLEGGAGVEVLLAHHEVERREQHLPGHQSLGRRRPARRPA